MIGKNKMKKFRNEVQKNWDLPVENLINKLDKQFDKLNEAAYDLSLALLFVLRYIEINKHHFERTDGLVSIISDNEEIPIDQPPSYEPKFRTVWEWVIKKYISVWKEFLGGIFIVGVEIKEWIDEEYEINFLEQIIKDIENQLENKDTSADNIFYRIKTNNAVYEINNQFKAGNYPNVFTTDPEMISYVEAMIVFRKYLKQKVARKQSSKEPEQLSIQGEIKGKKDSMGNLTIHLPLKEIEESLVEKLKNETTRVPSPIHENKLKLYTRNETAEMLKVSTVTLDKWVKQGIIKEYQLANKPKRFRAEDIENVLKEKKIIPFHR